MPSASPSTPDTSPIGTFFWNTLTALEITAAQIPNETPDEKTLVLVKSNVSRLRACAENFDPAPVSEYPKLADFIASVLTDLLRADRSIASPPTTKTIDGVLVDDVNVLRELECQKAAGIITRIENLLETVDKSIKLEEWKADVLAGREEGSTGLKDLFEKRQSGS